jgi:hypothetical protein
MLRRTTQALKSYRQRAMHAPHRWYKRKYSMPNRMSTSPLNGKNPESYGETGDWRCGKLWQDRRFQRNMQKGWPWVSIHDDPIGAKLAKQHHGQRTFSEALERKTITPPRYNAYMLSGRDFRIPPTAPLATLVPILNQHVSATVSAADCEAYVATIAATYATPLAVTRGAAKLSRACLIGSEVPVGFAKHVIQLSRSILTMQRRKIYRQSQHAMGVLRTPSMQRYYAMPPLVAGPPMPTSLAQPSQRVHKPFLRMQGMRLHPMIVVDDRTKAGKFPA